MSTIQPRVDHGPSSACIVGIGETQYLRRGGHVELNEFQLACQAIERAAADAGLEPMELDGLVTFADAAGDPSLLQSALGMRDLNFSSMVWGGRGGGACAAVAHAAAAVRAGAARQVAVVRSLCQGRTRRYGQFFADRPHTNFMAPFGLLSPPQMLSLGLQRHAADHELSRRAMMRVVMNCRDHAQRNPRAVLFGHPLTESEYESARPIAGPLTAADCCLETDGAAALIVARAPLGAGRPVVRIAAGGQSSPRGWQTGYMGSHNMPDYGTGGQRELAHALYAQAGMEPDDVDVAQFYDHFSAMVLLALEDFGFCEPGTSSAGVLSGLIEPHGRLPINTAGGSLAEAYVHGLNHVLEGVRQLRGESTSQVEGARVCLVTSASGITPTSGLILEGLH